jgi:glutamate synthase (NADPH/NADH) small chain
MPVKASEFDLPLAVAVIAIGTSANPIVQGTTPGLDTNKRGYIQTHEATQRTSRKGVFAGGDIVTGSDTVILAMCAGPQARSMSI